MTALLSNLVWKGSRNVVSYSLYTEREKNSGKQGPPRRGGAAQGHGRWTVCFRSGSATTHGNPASSCGCCWSGRWRGRSAPARLLEFSSGDALLGWMDRHAGELDLVFLDIEMEGTNGMDTARALREADQSLQLVFVTGYSDYVFDGYEVGALGYLLKPAGAEELERVLTRALTALQRQEEELFFCRSGEVFYRIRRDAILYFRSDRRQVTCVTPRRAYIFYGKLDQVAAQLGAEFVRIHQRYLVRAGAVDRVTGSEVWVGEEILPISRSCQREALLALTRRRWSREEMEMIVLPVWKELLQWGRSCWEAQPWARQWSGCWGRAGAGRAGGRCICCLCSPWGCPPGWGTTTPSFCSSPS